METVLLVANIASDRKCAEILMSFLNFILLNPKKIKIIFINFNQF